MKLKQKTKDFLIAVLIVILGLLGGLVIMGCGQGGGNPHSSGSIVVEGNIYNPSVATKPHADIHRAALMNSVHSTLVDITDPVRLDDLSVSDFIMVNTVVSNLTLDIYAGLYFSIEVEDANFLTPERWSCSLRYSCLSGTCAMGTMVWEVYGGILFNELPTPTLATCAGEPAKDPGFTCDASVYDCASPWWSVDYEQPGDGLWRASGTVPELSPAEVFTALVGYANTGMDLRSDHYARWSVMNSSGDIIAGQDCVFNVGL